MLTEVDDPQSRSLSICILTCNRDVLLKDLLTALVQQVEPCDEVLVLDTGGNDSTRQIVESFRYQQIKYHAYPMERFDFATARNQLLKLASGAGIVFIDDDAFPFPDWLQRVRANLNLFEAAGGVTVADGEMPDWWDPAINWCVGLSPRGTVLGIPGYYPDTCNLSARDSLWNEKPFTTVSRENRQLYATGREDAEWWTERRLEGRRIAVSYQQAVAHHVHRDRLQWPYVKQRAFNDGVSSWLRRPSLDAATAIPWDFAHILGVVIDKFLRKPFNSRYRLTDLVWMHRQWGKFIAVWKSSPAHRPRQREQAFQLIKAVLFQVRIRVGIFLFTFIKQLRRQETFPPENPETIFISADCHVGDSLLLRPHIQAVALTFPMARVIVSCRYPILLSELAPNVELVDTRIAYEFINEHALHLDAAIVPYFPFGDHRMWRKSLSPVGTTFDCDVSFAGRRDYLYARRVVAKNLEIHEHENLARLFRLWPLRDVPDLRPPRIEDADRRWHQSMLQQYGIADRYILIQFGAGHDFKEWPLDCWIAFLQSFCPLVDLPIIITGGENWKDAADIAVAEVAHQPGLFNSIAGSTLGQVMALVEGASFFIGGCSGPKHLAVAYGVPTFILYAATEPERWGADRDHHLHKHVTALPQKLTGMELQGLDKHSRSRILEPEPVAIKAADHLKAVIHRNLKQ